MSDEAASARVADLLDTDQAAAYVGVSRGTWLRRAPPSLPWFKRPRKWLRSQLDEWLRGQACSTNAAQSGGSSSVTTASKHTSRLVSETLRRHRQRLESSATSTKRSTAQAVDRQGPLRGEGGFGEGHKNRGGLFGPASFSTLLQKTVGLQPVDCRRRR